MGNETVRVKITLPDSVKIEKPKKSEQPPLKVATGGPGKPISALQASLREMVANLTEGEWYKVPMEGEAQQRALGNHLRNAVQATFEGKSAGLTYDDSHVWFRIQPMVKRQKRNQEEES